jgi:hypothetical protein
MNINMRKNKSFRSGFAMPGMILNITLGSAFLLGAGSFSLSNAHKVAAMASFPVLNSEGQNANSLIVQDLRQASSLESATSDRIVLSLTQAGDTSTVTYSYNRALGILTREDGQTTQTVLNNLDDFSFSLFQRSSANASFGSLASANAANASMVGCHWSCSRKFAGTKLDSEHIEMAPTVLRNHHQI